MASGGAKSPRAAAAEALSLAADQFPDLPPVAVNVAALDDRDARLALAIHRAALQRWITLEHLLDQFLRQPMRKLEPRLRGVLLSAAAQLLVMDRLPARAVVHESVELARATVRPEAAGLVNAVLRRFSQIVRTHDQQPWSPAVDRIPLEMGSIVLDRPRLPDPQRSLALHLGIVTSHPTPLVRQWLTSHEPAAVVELCRHSILTPPTIVAVEADFEPAAESRNDLPWRPHGQHGFIIWEGTRDQLLAFLAAHRARRVQDPAAARPVHAAAKLKPELILDYCAGRGTKTRQLANMHPTAQIIASDPDLDRLQDLQALNLPNVLAVQSQQVQHAIGNRRVDLLLLDVPCSNTAVLARRPEARYRYSQQSAASLVRLQRQIISDAVPLVAPGGHVLYVTCSLMHEENHAQARWLTRKFHATAIHEDLLLPSTSGDPYHDGSYEVLMQLPA